MSPTRKIAFGCYALAALMLFIFAARFLFSSSIMPYHLQVLGVDWMELPPNFQLMFKGLMGGAGIGMLVTGWAIVLLLSIPFRRGEGWADWGLLSVTLLFQLPMLGLIFKVIANSGAEPPLLLNIIMLFVTVSGFVLSRVRCTGTCWRRKAPETA